MDSTLITNIAELTTNDPSLGDGSTLGLMRDAALVMEEGRVAWVGAATRAPEGVDQVFDAEGCAVIPGLVDSHTHLVFAGDRSAEFAARMAGERYDGGGIMTTVHATRTASDDDLRASARGLRDEMRALGTTTVEIKSGYGLDTATEERLLRIAGEFTPETTFMGAHVVPPEYAHDREAYVDLVCGEMLAACAPHARWVDAFCDRGAFSADESRRVLQAGMRAGLHPRLHGNQLEDGPGVALAVELGCASVDHCTHVSDAEIEMLAASDTVATLLPGVEFATRSPYPDARRFLAAGATVSIATDCNPGSGFVTSMPLCIAFAVRDMSMTPAQALWAATAGGARALRRADIGRLSIDAQADVVVLGAPSHVHLAYRPGSNLTAAVWEAGDAVYAG